MIPSTQEALLETGVDLGPDADMVARFRRDLDALVPPDERFGVAVSGGPDSLALLLLAAAARPGTVEAATIDHALRAGSRTEAEMVKALCERLDVPHTTLTAAWDVKPRTAIQQRARVARYRLLDRWGEEKELHALLTGHHLDDQAETLVMRMARGAGVKGLAGMRRISRTPGGVVPLLRPLLGWRRTELQQVCASAGVSPVEDPSNEDEQFERVRIRLALAGAEWLDARAIALSAGNLAQADVALDWSSNQVWSRLVDDQEKSVSFEPAGIPREIRRRLIHRAVLKLATEGRGGELRGRELDRLLQVLVKGGKATLRGVLCTGGALWRFERAPSRRIS